MLQEVAVDRSKPEALPIVDLVGAVCITLFDDVMSLPFGSELAPILWVMMIGLLSANT